MNHQTLVFRKRPKDETTFIDSIKDIYCAEKNLVKALPKMYKAASSEELADILEKNLALTHEHIIRLEDVFKILGIEAEPAAQCSTMDEILFETSTIIKNKKDCPVCDDLIASTKKAELYKIASYWSLIQMARKIGKTEVAQIFDKTLQQEIETDKALTDLAKEERATFLNP